MSDPVAMTSDADAPAKTAPPAPPKENFLLNLGANILAPTLLLKYGGKALPSFSPAEVLLTALAFPVVYFILDYLRRRQAGPIAIFGFVSTLASGGIGLMKIDPFWFAVKEAAFPLVFLVTLYLTLALKKPLARAFVWNDSVMATHKIEAAIDARGSRTAIDLLFAWVTHRLAALFAASAVAQFLLARLIVKTGAAENETAFNDQVGTFTWVSYLAIMAPLMVGMVWIMLRFMRHLRDLTGLTDEEILRA